MSSPFVGEQAPSRRINNQPCDTHAPSPPSPTTTHSQRGYPFSLREGVPTVVSHGLWLNIPDYDAPTQVSAVCCESCVLCCAVLCCAALCCAVVCGLGAACLGWCCAGQECFGGGIVVLGVMIRWVTQSSIK